MVRQTSERWGDRLAAELTADLVRQWLRDRKAGGASARTLQKDRTMLFGLCAWAVGEDKLDRNPVAQVGRIKVPDTDARWLRPAEYLRLWNAAPGYLRDMLDVAVSTGLRSEELCRLRRSELQGGLIVIPGARRKNGRTLKVPCPPPLRELLCAQSERADGLVWTRPAAARVRSQSDFWKEGWLLRAVKRAARRAGLEGVTVHTLRHTCGTWLVAAGLRVRTVQHRMGHRHQITTEKHYLHDGEALDWSEEGRWLPKRLTGFCPAFRVKPDPAAGQMTHNGTSFGAPRPAQATSGA